MSETDPSRPASTIATRLGASRVALRDDLEITRQVLRGAVRYVVVDPITRDAHRFEPGDYDAITTLSMHETLSETLARLVQSGRWLAGDEDRFYRIVVALHERSLLKLALVDVRAADRREAERAASHARSRRSSFFSPRISLGDPDVLLGRTLAFARPFFTKPAFGAWILLVTVAVWIALAHRREITTSVAGMLTTEGLLISWLALVLSKTLHEAGHAYACKMFGGRVGDAGVKLALLTPCAYADTSSASRLSRKRDRILVSLAGAYIEIAAAAVAMIAWTATAPGPVRSVLFGFAFVASVAALIHNLNPFVRHDGHDVLAELVEVPHLARRSSDEVVRVAKRFFLGLATPRDSGAHGGRSFLLAYGIAAPVCNAALVLGAASFLATKLPVISALFVVAFFGRALVRFLRRWIPYLWSSRETQHIQIRARTLGWLAMLGLPLALLAIPVRSEVRTPGVVAGDRETVVRAEVAGFVSAVSARAGQEIDFGERLIELADPALALELSRAEANLAASRIRQRSHRGSDLAKVLEEEARARELEHERANRERDVASLSVRSPARGTLVECLKPVETGRYVARGEVLATIAGSALVVRTLVTEEALASAKPLVGQRVEFRGRCDPARVWPGRITRIAPRGERSIDPDEIAPFDPASFEYDARTRETGRSMFEIEIALDDTAAPIARFFGATGELAFVGSSEPIALRFLRSILGFTARLST